MAAMDEAAHGLANLLGRIGAFFDIFDLSFFVSGAGSVGALWFCYRKLDGTLFTEVDNHYLVVALFLCSYALGLVCFTLGRMLRQLLQTAIHRQRTSTRFRQAVEDAVRAHGLNGVALGPLSAKTLDDYLRPAHPGHGHGQRQGPDGAQKLYMLLWTRLRQSSHLQPSLQLLNRYWVMAATYDGMALAALLWAAVLWLWWQGLLLPAAGTHLAGAGAGACLGLCWLYLREAERYSRVQIGELVATMAWDHLAKPDPSPPPQTSTVTGVILQGTQPSHGP